MVTTTETHDYRLSKYCLRARKDLSFSKKKDGLPMNYAIYCIRIHVCEYGDDACACDASSNDYRSFFVREPQASLCN